MNTPPANCTVRVTLLPSYKVTLAGLIQKPVGGAGGAVGVGVIVGVFVAVGAGVLVAVGVGVAVGVKVGVAVPVAVGVGVGVGVAIGVFVGVGVGVGVGVASLLIVMTTSVTSSAVSATPGAPLPLTLIVTVSAESTELSCCGSMVKTKELVVGTFAFLGMVRVRSPLEGVISTSTTPVLPLLVAVTLPDKVTV